MTYVRVDPCGRVFLNGGPESSGAHFEIEAEVLHEEQLRATFCAVNTELFPEEVRKQNYYLGVGLKNDGQKKYGNVVETQHCIGEHDDAVTTEPDRRIKS